MSVSEGIRSLTERSEALQAAALHRITAATYAGGEDGGVRFFGEGLPAITARLAALERSTRSAVYNLQRWTPFDPLRREREPNERTRGRKIQGHLIAQEMEHLSLIASCHPDTWVAPVQLSGLVIDERLALFPGPPSPRGLPTAWLCDHPDLVLGFCQLWADVKQLATPIRDIPWVVVLTERQLDVVTLLSRGAKDATIARLLGVSLRTVTGDINRILNALQVGTRWEAGVVIGRASPPSMVRRTG